MYLIIEIAKRKGARNRVRLVAEPSEEFPTSILDIREVLLKTCRDLDKFVNIQKHRLPEKPGEEK